MLSELIKPYQFSLTVIIVRHIWKVKSMNLENIMVNHNLILFEGIV